MSTFFIFDLSLFIWIESIGSEDDYPAYLPFFHLVNALALVWILCHLHGFFKVCVSGAYGTWYWTMNKKEVPFFTTLRFIYITFRYHIGPTAFGSLVITVCTILHTLIDGGSPTSGVDGTPGLADAGLACCNAALYCIKVLVEAVTGMAYVRIGHHGTGFIDAGREALTLFRRNYLKVAIVKTMDHSDRIPLGHLHVDIVPVPVENRRQARGLRYHRLDFRRSLCSSALHGYYAVQPTRGRSPRLVHRVGRDFHRLSRAVLRQVQIHPGGLRARSRGGQASFIHYLSSRSIKFFNSIFFRSSRAVLAFPLMFLYSLAHCVLMFSFSIFNISLFYLIDSIASEDDYPSHLTFCHFVNALALVWINCHMFAFFKVSVSGAYGTWYWTMNKKDVPKFTTLRFIYITLRYHIGPTAFGSLIILVCIVLQFLIDALSSSSENEIPGMYECCMTCCQTAVYCIKVVVEAVTGMAYIRIGHHGSGFIDAARTSFGVFKRNYAKIIILSRVDDDLFIVTRRLSQLRISGLLQHFFLLTRRAFQVRVMDLLQNFFGVSWYPILKLPVLMPKTMTVPNDESDESKRECADGAGEKIDAPDPENTDNEDSTAKLKRMRKSVKWQIVEERKEFLRRLCALIEDWKGELPNLREIFRRSEIDWLLAEIVKSADGEAIDARKLIEFVIRTGYKDEPELDEAGKPLLLRTTAVHRATEHGESLIGELFVIYDKFEANYRDEESGLTHLHVACVLGRVDAVGKFLDLGEDPNCLTRKWRNTTLNLALYCDRTKVAELVLSRGADLTLANGEGLTPLHMIAKRIDCADFVETFFKTCEEKKLKLPIDAKDKTGDTALHWAMRTKSNKVVEWLLRKGADPKSVNSKGKTPLHVLCTQKGNAETVELFFKIIDEAGQTLDVDARDKHGWTPLHLALGNDTEAVEMLLRRGADPNSATPEGTSSLHAIVQRADDSHELLKKFFEICSELRKRVKIDAADKGGRTPLQWALSRGHKRVVELLLRRDADPYLYTGEGSTSLHVICYSKDDSDDLMRTLLEIGEEKKRPARLDVKDTYGRTPLHLTLRHGRKKTAEWLLRRGANPNADDTDGLTCLHHIAIRDDDWTEWFLGICNDIRRKVPIDVRDRSGDTPLQWAVRAKNEKVIESLLGRGASPSSANGKGLTSLHMIARRWDCAELGKAFLKICDEKRLKLPIDVKDEEGDTPLHLAVRYEHSEMIESLLRRGANPSLVNAKGRTPLHVASAGQDTNVETMELFFKMIDETGKTVDIHAREKLGWTPLHLAAYHSQGQEVELLLRRGADLNLACNDGSTVLQLICDREKDDEFMELFFEYVKKVDRPIELNARGKGGSTPLHWALKKDKKRMARVLLSEGANPSLTDKNGRTALHSICLLDERRDKELFVEIAEELRYRGRIDARDKSGDTALHLALSNGKNLKASSLLIRGADPNLATAHGLTPLHLICQCSVVADYMVNEFFKIAEDLNVKVLVDAPDKMGNSPLHLALSNGNKIKAEWLLRWGANPNLVNGNGSTPLHVICNRKIDDDLAETFFEINEDIQQTVLVDAKDECGRTPLHLAVARGSPKVTESLLRNGADPNVAGAKGSTPLHIVCKSDYGGRDFARAFFELLADTDQWVEIDAVDNLGNAPLHLALTRERENAVEFLLRHTANPNLANAEGLTPLHIVCQGSLDEDRFLDQFFKIAEEENETVIVDPRDKTGNTPLHLALRDGKKKKAETLLRRGADPNAANSEGSTCLHHIAARKIDDDLTEWFLVICDDIQRTVPVDVKNKSGDTPLHLALRADNKKTAKYLLERGADINLTNEEGWTPLHIIAKRDKDDGWLEQFFKIVEDIRQTVQIDARDHFGNSPLHVALLCGTKATIESLLRKGADPNLAEKDGSTPLHFIARREQGDDSVDMFFEIIEDMRRAVEVDVQDDFGRTPLHLAVERGSPKVTEALLRNGADPNLATADGLTPLHVMCQRQKVDGFPEKFFELIDATDQWVQVDARDKKGRTPLQLAVANLLPNALDVLLDHGADLSSFVFPDLNHDDEKLKPKSSSSNCHRLRLAAGSMAVVERLAKRGHELDRKDVLKIVKLFVEYGMFERTDGLEKCWYDDERFAGIAREMMTRPEETEKIFASAEYSDYSKRSKKISQLSKSHQEACAMHLCERLSRTFFHRRAVDAFRELIRRRVSIESCDMIMQWLRNVDLCHPKRKR
ncbi:unnamed protein product [Trichogramma brassicae]|uniref:Uncharacterized protein n=1 Tax=Trichogramma brassicae TaxID=86971 RepID=A0A6H5I224_9HYME|nr:unnamed protein product [Trichogramma brassicae]